MSEYTIQIASNFLIRQGYKILDVSWQSANGDVADVVVKSADDVLIFIKVYQIDETNKDTAKPGEDSGVENRKIYENISSDYLQAHALSGMDVRFDSIYYQEIESRFCFIRHHIGTLN